MNIENSNISSFGTVKPTGGLWRLSRFCIAVAVFGLPLTEFGPLATSSAAQPTTRTEPRGTRQILAKVVAAVTADPKNAETIMQNFMRANPKIADKIAKAAIGAIPKKDGQPDTYKIAQMLKAALDVIYAELPDARSQVTSIVLAAIEALRNSDGISDPQAVSVVLSMVLPEIAANDRGVIDSLMKAVLALVPDAESILNQLLADLFTPLESPGTRLGRRSMTVEPSFINTAP